MNNLRKFENEAAYSATTLSYPAVSWIVSGDTVHYDKTSGETPSSAEAVKIAFSTDSCGDGDEMGLCSDAGCLDMYEYIKVNGTPLTLESSEIYLTLSANTDYVIEYGLKPEATEVGYCFQITTPWACASETIKYDILFPAQVTNIGDVNCEQLNNIIILAETPPTAIFDSSCHGDGVIYVPDEVVNDYKTAWASVYLTNYIYPLSEYEGNLPVD